MFLNKKINLSIFFCLAAFLTSCQDVVTVDLEEGTPQLVVDAWLNNKSETQTIKLRKTSAYFDNAPSPVVTGAIVGLVDSQNNIFEFTDEDNDGNYTWTPADGETIGEVGTSFTLGIQIGDDQYVSFSTMNPTTVIDSVTYEEGNGLGPGGVDGVYADFFARDLPGLGNTYWIKTYKNGQYLNKPQELSIAYDASQLPGTGVDGVVFIPPVRSLVNRFPDLGDDAVDDIQTSPYAIGDSIYVEIHSITEEAFFFLELARNQMTLGDQTLFAPPPSNVFTNIINPNDSTTIEKQPVGFFCVSAVSGMGLKIQ